MNDPLLYMHTAYELALKGWGKVSPNPMVGAVLVKAGKIIAQGWHPYCGGPHAEAMAIGLAGKKAAGADLYVTLEPCSHFGRTPPCTDAIIRAGIKRVYVGVLDPNPRMNGKSITLLRKAGIEVHVGFCEQELMQLNEAFAKHITTGVPLVTAKIAQTLDGKVATASGESKWITSPQTRAYSRRRRFDCGAIMVGIGTVNSDDPVLDALPRKRYKKVVLDTHLKIPARAKLFGTTRPEDLIIFTTAAPKRKLGGRVVQAPARAGKVDLAWVLAYLGKEGINHVLIEGGPTVIGAALKQGLVDKVMIYVAPLILGEGMDAVSGLKLKQLKQALALKNMRTVPLGRDLLIEGDV